MKLNNNKKEYEGNNGICKLLYKNIYIPELESIH